jgi:hypothetical protein
VHQNHPLHGEDDMSWVKAYTMEVHLVVGQILACINQWLP